MSMRANGETAVYLQTNLGELLHLPQTVWWAAHLASFTVNGIAGAFTLMTSCCLCMITHGSVIGECEVLDEMAGSPVRASVGIATRAAR